MSDLSAYFYVMMESKSGWKKYIKEELDKLTLDHIHTVTFEATKTGYPGWKNAVFSCSYRDDKDINNLLRMICEHGFKHVYVETIIEQAGATIYSTIINNNLITFESREEIEAVLIQSHTPEEPNYLSNHDEEHDKLLIKLKLRKKSIENKLISLVSSYINRRDKEAFQLLFDFNNKEANKYYEKERDGCELLFPKEKWGQNTVCSNISCSSHDLI